MRLGTATAIPASADSNFPATSLRAAFAWHRRNPSWPASKAYSLATVLSATLDGLCDCAQSDPNFLEAAACELVQDTQLLVVGRLWHTQRILRAAVPASARRIEKCCTAISSTFRSSGVLHAAPDDVAVQCMSSVFSIARNVPQADVSWAEVCSCVISWCCALLPACQQNSITTATVSSCFRVLSLIADASRARLCPEFLSHPSCVQLVCLCCVLKPVDEPLLHLSIEMLDIILSYCALPNSSSNSCMPVVGCSSKSSIVWQSPEPFGISSVLPFSANLISFLVSKLQLQPSDCEGDDLQLFIPDVVALNCLRCLNSLLWHDESSCVSVLTMMPSLERALRACSRCRLTAVQRASVFVRCTVLLRCKADFVDEDGCCCFVSERQLLHLFPEISRMKSPSVPQSSSQLRPLSASTPAVVESADMMIFCSEDLQHRAVHCHDLLSAALRAVFELPVPLSDHSELACAVLDTATVISISSDRFRKKLIHIGDSLHRSLWGVLLQSVDSSVPCVRTSALQLAAALRHNAEFLDVLSCSGRLISSLRRCVEELSRSSCSNLETKAAACACSLLHSIVITAPTVAGDLIYGRRYGRAAAPYECEELSTACLQRVHREEDEASDVDDSAVRDNATEILDVESEFLVSEAHSASCLDFSLPHQPLSPLLPGSRQTSPFTSRVRESSVPSSSQRQRALCVGRHGSKRQQRFMAGLEQGILSSSVTCRFGALQLAAELAAAFVSDGCPVLIIATAAAGDSCASVSSAVQPSAAVTFSARRAMQHSLSAADARIHSHTPLFLRRLALLLTDSRCIETAAAFLREASPCLHQAACKFISGAINAGAALQMRTQVLISKSLIHSMNAALQRVLHAHPVLLTCADAPADTTDFPVSNSPSTTLTKMRTQDQHATSFANRETPTFSPLQYAAPVDVCGWPVASKQLTVVAMLDGAMRALAQVLDASDTGAAMHFTAAEWELLARNIRLLIQRGKYYDLPQHKHKNIQSDVTTAAALQLLAACVRARCDYSQIIEDSAFLEALFGVMNNPGAAGPSAALAATLELAKLPGTQRALSSTFGFMTGTKAGARWKNSAMSRASREIAKLCANGVSPSAKTALKSRSMIASACSGVEHDDEEADEDSAADGFVPATSNSVSLPPISSHKTSRGATSLPLLRTTPTPNARSPSKAASLCVSSPAAPRLSPGALNLRSGAGVKISQGARSPVAAALPALKQGCAT